MSISRATKLEQICQAKRNQISPMKPQTVWSWFRRARKGLTLREMGGLPRKLDAVSHEKLLGYCALHHPVPLDHLRGLIHKEYVLSHRRGNGLGEGDDSMDSSWPQMSKRTTYNYVQRYRVGVWGPEL
jgi:hypothetical protein